MTEKTAEQQARDLLESYGLENAQSLCAGDLVELANLIADADQGAPMINDKDRQIRALQRQIRDKDVVIDTLRGLLFTAWRLTHAHDDDIEENDD